MEKSQKKSNKFLVGAEYTFLFETMEDFQTVLKKVDVSQVVQTKVEVIMADGAVYKAKLAIPENAKLIEYIGENDE